MPHINPDYNVPPVQRKQASKYVEAPSSTSQAKSSVEVSATARELNEALNLARQAPDVRTERVEQLRAEIESGSYSIDLERLAEFLADRL